MFKKLQREITIYNAIVLILFFVFFCGSIYIFMKSGMDASIEHALKARVNIAMKWDIERMKDRHPNKKPLKDYRSLRRTPRSIFDVQPRVDIMFFNTEKDMILNTNLYLDVYSDMFKQEIDKSFDKVEKVNIDGKDYVIYCKRIKSSGYFTLGIHDYEATKAFLNGLLRMILIISIGAIVVLIIISRIFAKRAVIPIQMSWDKQKRFVADASHELRTPLTVMQINLEAALSNEDSTIKENKIWLENALTEASLMTKLVNDLLLLANIDSNQVYNNFEDVNLSFILNSTIDRMEDMAGSNDLVIYRDIREDIIIHGDKVKLMQLFTILMDNAIKYNKPKGEIFVGLILRDKDIEISFRDTGIGIEEKNMGRIFDRFYMEDKTRSKEKGSSGLGLSIAKWIVNLHKGNILVESEKDKGSIFKVLFYEQHVE